MEDVGINSIPGDNMYVVKPMEQNYLITQLPDELIQTILVHYPDARYSQVCKKFHINSPFNQKVYQTFHKIILKNLISNSIDYLQTHQRIVRITEKFYPFAKGLPINTNKTIKELLSKEENLKIKEVIDFWESCHGDMSYMTFNDLALTNCILNGHHNFSLEVFQNHADYPLNISPWKMNGEEIENRAYCEVRKNIIYCLGYYLLEKGKLEEFLVVLSKEYLKIIRSGFDWDNLVNEEFKPNLSIPLLFQNCRPAEYQHLVIGLALIYPPLEGENEYLQILESKIEFYINQEEQDELFVVINSIVSKNK